MNDFNIIEWTCAWTISMVAFVGLIKLYAKWKNL